MGQLSHTHTLLYRVERTLKRGITEKRTVVTHAHTHTHTLVYRTEKALKRGDVENGTDVTYTHILIQSGENP